jgi:two-component system sensor histidine kinase/response regulator
LRNRQDDCGLMKKVVIIDDEPSMRKNLARMLETESFQVWTAEDGLEGLDSIEKNLPDVILCDVVMPRLDGFDLLQKVKSSNATALTPVILLSGRSEKNTVRRGMELGADDYLVKPFTTDELLNSIQSQLNKQAAFDSRTHEKLQEKSHFVSCVMHDFRGPLAILLLSIETLQDERLKFSPKEKSNLLAEMRHQIAHMSQMLEELLSQAETEHKACPAHFSEVELSGLCRRIVDEIRLLNRQRTVELVVPEQEVVVQTDELLLRQTILNLLLNAVKYSPSEKRVLLRVCQDKESVDIEIQDQGIGISAEDQKRIFKPFERGSNSEATHGSGYGLCIVKSYLDRIGGELDVKSEQGIGSCFTVRLPIRSNS